MAEGNTPSEAEIAYRSRLVKHVARDAIGVTYPPRDEVDKRVNKVALEVDLKARLRGSEAPQPKSLWQRFKDTVWPQYEK